MFYVVLINSNIVCKDRLFSLRRINTMEIKNNFKWILQTQERNFYSNRKDLSKLYYIHKKSAPGEARTHNLRISPILSYKYGALTDCATGATHALLICSL